MKTIHRPTTAKKVFSPPPQILIKSDGNELKFESKSRDVYTYRYTKSNHKLGLALVITEEHLIKLLKNNQ